MKGLGSTLSANLALGALGLATGVLSARLLGPDGRGQLALIQLWPTLLATVAVLGMPESLVYFSARERSRAGGYVVSAVALALVSGALLMALGWFVLPVVLRAHGAGLTGAAREYLLIIPLFVTVLLPTHVLRGLGHFAWWNVLRLGPALSWLSVLVMGFILNVRTPRTIALLSLLLLGSLGAVVTAVVWSKTSPPYRPDRRSISRLLHFGLPAFGATLPQLLNLRLDQLVMAAFLPPREIGYYVVAVAWSTMSTPLLMALGQVIFPHIAALADGPMRDTELAKASRTGIGLGLLTTLAVGVATPLALPRLLSPAFQPAVAPAVVLVLAGCVFGYGFILAEGIRGLGRPGETLRAEVAGVVVTAMSLALLLPPFGIMGAALASLAGYTTVVLWYWAFLRRARIMTSWSVWVVPRPDELLAHVRSVLKLAA